MHFKSGLKQHFPCDIRSADLKKLAKSEMSEKSFRELLEYLHEEGRISTQITEDMTISDQTNDTKL